MDKEFSQKIAQWRLGLSVGISWGMIWSFSSQIFAFIYTGDFLLISFINIIIGVGCIQFMRKSRPFGKIIYKISCGALAILCALGSFCYPKLLYPYMEPVILFPVELEFHPAGFFVLLILFFTLLLIAEDAIESTLRDPKNIEHNFLRNCAIALIIGAVLLYIHAQYGWLIALPILSPLYLFCSGGKNPVTSTYSVDQRISPQLWFGMFWGSIMITMQLFLLIYGNLTVVHTARSRSVFFFADAWFYIPIILFVGYLIYKIGFSKKYRVKTLFSFQFMALLGIINVIIILILESRIVWDIFQLQHPWEMNLLFSLGTIIAFIPYSWSYYQIQKNHKRIHLFNDLLFVGFPFFMSLMLDFGFSSSFSDEAEYTTFFGIMLGSALVFFVFALGFGKKLQLKNQNTVTIEMEGNSQ